MFLDSKLYKTILLIQITQLLEKCQQMIVEDDLKNPAIYQRMEFELRTIPTYVKAQGNIENAQGNSETRLQFFMNN